MRIATNCIAFLLICTYSSEVAAQSEPLVTPNDSRQGFFALGGVGPAIPIGKYGRERSPGFDFNTAVECRFRSNFLLRGMFDFSSFAFERGTISQTSNGKLYALSGSNNLVTLAITGGYAMKRKRFSTYLFAGFGASFLSKPGIEVNELENYVDTNLVVKGYLSTMSGAGLDFLLNPDNKKDEGVKKSLFLVYIEAFNTFIPALTETSVHKFNVVSFNVGIKNKF